MSRPHKLQRNNRRYQFGNLRRELEEHCEANGEAWIASLGPLGRPLQQWVDGVIDALGGEDRVTPQRKTMIILAAKSLLIAESVDRFIFSMPSVINRSRKQLFGIVEQRGSLVAHLFRQLQAIGIEAYDPSRDAALDELMKKYADRVAHQIEDGSRS